MCSVIKLVQSTNTFEDETTGAISAGKAVNDSTRVGITDYACVSNIWRLINYMSTESWRAYNMYTVITTRPIITMKWIHRGRIIIRMELEGGSQKCAQSHAAIDVYLGGEGVLQEGHSSQGDLGNPFSLYNHLLPTTQPHQITLTSPWLPTPSLPCHMATM